MKDFITEVAKIQAGLKAPKNQQNNFGKYAYRSCEDILEALKPLLKDLVVTVTDEIVMIGDRFYIKATASITNGSDTLSVDGYAREAQTKKGMDEAQITGSVSSYARKYALNGLFLIDDNKDADSAAPPEQQASREEFVISEEKLQLYAASIIGAKSLKDLKEIWNDTDGEYRKHLESAKETAKKQLMGAGE